MAKLFIDTKQIDRLTFELKEFPEEVAIATYHALRRTMDQVVTQTGRIVTKSYSIKARDVKDSFKGGIKKPTKSDLSASLTSRGHTLSLVHFSHTPKVQGNKKYKVKVTIKRDKGRQTVNTNPLPFIASTGAKSSEKIQYNFFRREGSSRLPIKVIRTLSVPQMISNAKVADQIQKAAAEKLNERHEHEIIRAMTTSGNRIKKG